MCLSLGFVLAAMVELAVRAAVACQPALPLHPCLSARRRVTEIPVQELAAADARMSKRSSALLGLRFSCEGLCLRARFGELQRLLRSRFLRVNIDSSPGNAFTIREQAHSVLTADFVDRPGYPPHDTLLRRVPRQPL
jgi:hypothetical protein